MSLGTLSPLCGYLREHGLWSTFTPSVVRGLKCTVNPSTESQSLRIGPASEQVDPPHLFRSAIKTVVIAAVLVTLAIAIFGLYRGQRRRWRLGSAAGELSRCMTLLVERARWECREATTYDQLLILAKARVRNQNQYSLVPAGHFRNRNDARRVQQTTCRRSYGCSPGFSGFSFSGLHFVIGAFDRDATVPPGQSTADLRFFTFPLTKQQWDSRRYNVVVSLIHRKRTGNSSDQLFALGAGGRFAIGRTLRAIRGCSAPGSRGPPSLPTPAR